MTPTRVIEHPEILPGTRNARRGELLCLCDDNNFYTFKELGKIWGKRPASLYESYRRHGYHRVRI